MSTWMWQNNQSRINGINVKCIYCSGAPGLGVLQLRVDGAQERGKIYYLITVQERATKFVI